MRRPYLVLALAIVAVGVGWGIFGQRTPRPTAANPADPDRWAIQPNLDAPEYNGLGRFRSARDPGTLPSDHDAAQLMALPYVAGSTDATALSGVIVYDEARAQPGLNLYTSGHAPAAFVMDMAGNVRHTWTRDIKDVWPDHVGKKFTAFWRRAHWFPNGDLLAIFEGTGIIKLDRHSNLLWSFKGGCHHQAAVLPDNRIWVLTRSTRRVPRINATADVLVDKLALLGPDGKLLDEFSLYDAFVNSDFAWVIDELPSTGDIMHVNTVHVLDGALADRAPHFTTGNVLISALVPDVLAIVDPAAQRVVWAQSGRRTHLWKRQHDPRLLPSGNMLLFDNLGRGGRSRALEIDPTTARVIWQYPGSADDPFHSNTCGLAQRLANGNTLLTESDNGRAVEVTPGGEIVWEFYSPHRAGDDDELVATLFELHRVPADYFPWLK